jgi:phenylpropionate dioxygenase-like ring-hydroxylating dioxygenase large terminal subunit
VSEVPSEHEIEVALRRAWFPVARRSELTAPKRVSLLGETLAVYLTESGEPRAVQDRCAHRGASLSRGDVTGERIACAYHGWEWNGSTGRCEHIPSLSDGAGIPPSAVIARYPTAERWGLVWSCLDDPALDVPDPEELADLRWSYGQGLPMQVAAGIRNATENFRDVAHFPFVHRRTMGLLPHAVEPLKVARDGTSVRLNRSYDASGGEESMWQEGMRFSYHAIAPAFVCLVMDHGGGRGKRILLNAPSPHTAPTRPGPDGRHHSTIFWVEGMTDDLEDITLEECLESEAQVYEEDNPILDLLEPSEAPLDVTEQVHTAADRYTLEYRRAFVEFVREAR